MRISPLIQIATSLACDMGPVFLIGKSLWQVTGIGGMELQPISAGNVGPAVGMLVDAPCPLGEHFKKRST